MRRRSPIHLDYFARSPGSPTLAVIFNFIFECRAWILLGLFCKLSVGQGFGTMTRVRTRLLPFNKPQVPGLWYGVFSVLVGLASLVEQADAVRNSPAQTWTRTKEIASGSHTLEFNPFETIAAYQDEFTKLYNQKNFTELAGMYCGHSLTLKKDSSKFYNSSELPGLFEEIYTSGLKEIDTAPAVIFQVSARFPSS